MESMDSYRALLKSERWTEWEGLETDQRQGAPAPPLEKPCPAGATLVDLVPPGELTSGTMPLIEAIRKRRSRRQFTDEPLTLEELSFLLWATQGVREVAQGGASTRRTVPSAGGRHPFETYIAVYNVAGLAPGLYRYLPLEHRLCLLQAGEGLAERVIAGCRGQRFAGRCAATFIWTVLPYRAEWRYSIIAHKMIAQDAGHLCQNLYLASEAIGAGTCAIGAYDQATMDAVVGVDGRDECTIYAAPVGKVKGG
ncbi:MAG TPA: SagB/ThcOx family dehydrogenase [Anaerolineae bacterium]|nr:SagB/ThcOx family dehydrogenase [Anaerolineae bacterium]HOQ99001.1 SagB/ThcOx family dehydrogenase [Anaerolineae bacterium]HPL29527.1 SagB/ThcOx family dehydrogenase [Anaerolineae bacterium]